MVNLSMTRKYTAFTLLEMLVVLGIIMILMGMTAASFLGLNNAVRMNEYMMTLEQDIRRMQRASMLLERNPIENWLYGIGIDFTNMEPDGEYRVFKWCTPYSDYGPVSTTSIVPAYEPGLGIESAEFPQFRLNNIQGNFCGGDVSNKTELRILPGYQNSLTIPFSEITFGPDNEDLTDYNGPVIVVFESVSGRAFFYNKSGQLLNYYEDDNRLILRDTDEIQDLTITISPIARGGVRQITIKHLSGKVHN